LAATTATRAPAPLRSKIGVATVMVGRPVNGDVYAFWTIVRDWPVTKKSCEATDLPSSWGSVESRTTPARSTM